MVKHLLFSSIVVAAVIWGGLLLMACTKGRNPDDNSSVPREQHTEDSLSTDTPQAVYWENKDHFMLQTHTVGKGIAIVIVGDGFDRNDNKKGGFYETVCRELADTFLSNPIIRDFKEYFDIYAVVAESKESGTTAGTNNAFGSGSPNGVDFGAANAFTVEAVPALGAMVSRSWIFVGNGMIGGFANFGDHGNCGSGVFSTAEGVNGYWMAHEFVGHAFASLADEYDASSFGPGYYGGASALDSYLNDNMLLNCSTTSDPAQVPWKNFIGREGYEEVGVYAGGFGENAGIWRPEQWSIMVGNNHGNELYYDAQSRWLIYKRIHDIAGIAYSFEEFLKYDKAYNVK